MAALDLDEFVDCLQDIVQHRTVIPRKLLAADTVSEHMREALRRVFAGYRPPPPPRPATLLCVDSATRRQAYHHWATMCSMANLWLFMFVGELMCLCVRARPSIH